MSDTPAGGTGDAPAGGPGAGGGGAGTGDGSAAGGPPPSSTRRWLGAAGGLGFLPVAPGTWGSLGTALVVALLVGVEGWWPGLVSHEEPLLGAGLVAALVACIGVGVRIGDRAELDWGRDDPGGFVLDEVAGQLLTLIPAVHAGLTPLTLAVGFAAFRLFDITKPPPCRRLEALHGGVGIMGDDLAAGIYGALVVLAVTAL